MNNERALLEKFRDRALADSFWDAGESAADALLSIVDHQFLLTWLAYLSGPLDEVRTEELNIRWLDCCGVAMEWARGASVRPGRVDSSTAPASAEDMLELVEAYVAIEQGLWKTGYYGYSMEQMLGIVRLKAPRDCTTEILDHLLVGAAWDEESATTQATSGEDFDDLYVKYRALREHHASGMKKIAYPAARDAVARRISSRPPRITLKYLRADPWFPGCTYGTSATSGAP